MITVQAHPHANFYVHARRYRANEAGVVEDVHPDDVAALINSGCIATAPWRHPALAVAPAPSVQPAMATVQLRGRPGTAYQPQTGVRYTADADGFFNAAAEHAKALTTASCELVVPPT